MRNNKMPQRVKSASNENKVKIEEEASTSFPLAENSGEDDPNVAEVRDIQA